MKFAIIDVKVTNDSATEFHLDSGFMKTAGYEAKIVNGTMKTSTYKNVMIRLPEKPFADMAKAKEFAEKAIIDWETRDATTISGVYSALEGCDPASVSVSIITTGIDQSDISITYTDGSSHGKSGEPAAYSAIQVLGVSYDPSALYEEFTESMRSYKTFAGRIEVGSNNIGELTGIKTAVDNFDGKIFQVVISDSEYSIKCFREWYYTWDRHGFKASNGKTVAHLDLIKGIKAAIESSRKIVILKWTKGHDDNSFNEKCDELAKSQIGIRK